MDGWINNVIYLHKKILFHHKRNEVLIHTNNMYKPYNKWRKPVAIGYTCVISFLWIGKSTEIKEISGGQGLGRNGVIGMGEPGGLPFMGLHRVGHDWSDLAAAAYMLGRGRGWWKCFKVDWWEGLPGQSSG